MSVVSAKIVMIEWQGKVFKYQKIRSKSSLPFRTQIMTTFSGVNKLIPTFSVDIRNMTDKYLSQATSQ